MTRIHIISIGDFTMCHLAIALKKKGLQVSGSDTEIDDSRRLLLEQHGLMPSEMGWNADSIVKGIDAIIPAMHLDESNPELARAVEKGLLVLSFPEFIYRQTKDKVRLVVSGSKGKTSVISMMFYALKKNKIAFDYATLGQIKEGLMSVSLSYDTRIALLEGDEFRTSPLEKKPVHQFYHPQIVLLTNLKWEESEEFSSFDAYLSSFKKLVEGIARDGKYIFYEGDLPLQSLTSKLREDITEMPYKAHDIIIEGDETMLKTRFGNFPVKITDEYFLQNLNGARLACRQLGLPDKEFYAAISEFSLANN